MRRGKSTDKIYKRIEKSVDKIISMGKLQDREIVIFGCTMWAKLLIELLSKKGFLVKAFADNNPQKAGGKCQGIDVYSPEALLKGFENKYIVLICSSYWREMSAQIEKIGYIRDKSYSVIFYEDEVGHFWKNCLEVVKGYKFYHKLIQTYGKAHKQIFVCPYGASGDVYMAGLFFHNYRKKHNLRDYLFIVDNKLAERTANLFEIKNIIVVSEEETKSLLHAWSFFGQNIIPLKPLLYWGWRTKRFPNPDSSLDVTFLDLMRYDVYDLDSSALPTLPKISKKDYAQKYFEENKLIPGKTIILAPYAGSFSSDISSEFWKNLAHRLSEMGFIVCTNSAGDNEPLIDGTKPVFFPLDAAVDIVNLAGYFISVRSGFCDVLSGTSAKFIVLYERALNAVKYEFFSFKRMGLNLRAVELIYDSEDDGAFLNRVLEAIK